jgi:hypothetical protein
MFASLQCGQTTDPSTRSQKDIIIDRETQNVLIIDILQSLETLAKV